MEAVPEDTKDYPQMKEKLQAALVTEDQAVTMYSEILKDLKINYPSLRQTATKIAGILKDEQDHQGILKERIQYLIKYRNAI
jgi:rubrerythrin